MRKLFVRNYNTYIPPIPPTPSSRDWSWDSVEYVTSVAGRKFARHPFGNGTVMGFNDGTERAVLILDAYFRKTSGYYYYKNENVNINSLLPSDKQLYVCEYTGAAAPSKNTTDADLNTYPFSWIANADINGSKYNTDCLSELGNDAAAAHYCRDVEFEIGVGCDLPNVNTLFRIHTEMEMIDNMDPTIGVISDYSIEEIFNRSLQVWSSSFYYNSHDGEYKAITMDKYNGSYSIKLDRNDFGIIPVLELNLV